MAQDREISWIRDKIAPPRFVAFLVILIVAVPALSGPLGWQRAIIVGFDVAATFFLVAISPLLKKQEGETMKRTARENDANRAVLLLVTIIVTLAIVVVVALELQGERPNVPLVIGTLAVTWAFSTTVFAFHYAFMFWVKDEVGGFDFPGTEEPDFVDFLYFAATLGVAFATSDVRVTDRGVRIVVVVHCVSAFVFNVGVVSFSISVLGG